MINCEEDDDILNDYYTLELSNTTKQTRGGGGTGRTGGEGAANVNGEGNSFDISILVASLGFGDTVLGSDESDNEVTKTEEVFINRLVERRAAENASMLSFTSDGDCYESAEEGMSDTDGVGMNRKQTIEVKAASSSAMMAWPSLIKEESESESDSLASPSAVVADPQATSYFPSPSPTRSRFAASGLSRSSSFNSARLRNYANCDEPTSSISVQDFVRQSWTLPTSSPSLSPLSPAQKEKLEWSTTERRRVSITPTKPLSLPSSPRLPLSPSMTNTPDYQPSTPIRLASSTSLASLSKRQFTPSPRSSIASSSTFQDPWSSNGAPYSVKSTPPPHRSSDYGSLSSPRKAPTPSSSLNPLSSPIDASRNGTPSPLRATPPARLRRASGPALSLAAVSTSSSTSSSPSPARRLSYAPPPSPSAASKSRRFSALFGLSRKESKDLTRSIQIITPHSSLSTSAQTPFRQETWRSTWSPSEFAAMERDLNLTPMEIRRQEVIFELGLTERTFVEGQRDVIRVFAVPLRKPSGGFIAGVPVAFGFLLEWLEDIVNLHAEIASMMTDLRRNCTTGLMLRFAAAFQPFVRRLEVHQPYLVRFEAVTKAIDMMTEDESSTFGEFLRRQSKLPELCGLPLASFLLKPLQRLMKLPLFFKQLCDLTPPSHVDHTATILLYKSTDSIIRLMQDVKSREDEYSELKRLVSRIHGLPKGFTLAKRNRRLLAYGSLSRVHIRDKHSLLILQESNAASSSSSAPSTLGHSTSSSSPAMTTLASARRAAAATTTDRPSSFGSDSSRSSTGSTSYSSSSESTAISPASSSHSSDKLRSTFTSAFPITRSVAQSASLSAKAIKTKAPETSCHVFVFSDLVLFTKKEMESKGNGGGSHSRKKSLGGGSLAVAEEDVSTFRVELDGLVQIVGVADRTGMTEHEHLIALTVIPFDASLTTPGASPLVSTYPTKPSSTAPSIVYLTLPPSLSTTPSSSRRGSVIDSPSTNGGGIMSTTGGVRVQERTRWLQVFERPYFTQLVAARALRKTRSSTSLRDKANEGGVGKEREKERPRSPTLEYGTARIGSVVAGSLSPSIPPTSPQISMTRREGNGGTTGGKGEGVREQGDEVAERQRVEREWWSRRLNEVRKEMDKSEAGSGSSGSLLGGRRGSTRGVGGVKSRRSLSELGEIREGSIKTSSRGAV